MPATIRFGESRRRGRRCRHRRRAGHHRPAASSTSPAATACSSARAVAGKEATIPIIVTNTGTAPADDIKLSGTAPSGWKIEFEPKTIDRIAPNKNEEVQALITPPEKSIAGDYVADASRRLARRDAASTQFRVTVTTSTLWGIAGVGIIGAALLIMVGAVARFGRR